MLTHSNIITGQGFNKISIQVVDNGYIVKVIDEGECSLKTRYIKPVFTFHTLEEINNFIISNLGKPSNEID